MTFVTDAHVGRNADMRAIRDSADAVVLAAGATKPRDLPIEGRCGADAYAHHWQPYSWIWISSGVLSLAQRWNVDADANMRRETHASGS